MTREGNADDADELTQPGGRVSKQTYERFREFVRRKHGKVRGNLGTELEKAMQDRMDAANGGDPIARIESDVASIKAMLADGEADGGDTLPTPSGTQYTHTRPEGKPPANAPREHKIDYLLGELLEETATDEDFGECPKAVLRNIIEDEYSFGERTRSDYFEVIVERLGAVQHPKYEHNMVWGGKIAEVKERLREEVKTDAEIELEELDHDDEK